MPDALALPKVAASSQLGLAAPLRRSLKLVQPPQPALALASHATTQNPAPDATWSVDGGEDWEREYESGVQQQPAMSLGEVMVRQQDLRMLAPIWLHYCQQAAAADAQVPYRHTKVAVMSS
jgi:uncharacterized iron-regulated membrane protein